MTSARAEVPSVPAWVALALADIGVVEFPGLDSNPAIEEMHGFTAAGKAGDEVPWCSSALCKWFELAGIKSTRSKTAASWAKWGYAVTPRIGAVVVFGKRDADAGGSGHCGIILGVHGPELAVISGNCANSVKIKYYRKADVVAIRWPSQLT
jgi:uncharacterized protein (TIGR02594 family)